MSSMEYRLHQASKPFIEECGKVLLSYRTGIASSTPTETCKEKKCSTTGTNGSTG